MFGKTRIYEVLDDEGAPVRLLEVGGIVQSGTYVDERYNQLVFEYLKRYDVLFDLVDDVRSVCVLGCGGYDYPKHLIANHPGVIVDAVEIDPAITALAKRYFFLDRLIEEYDTETTGRLRLVCSDALDYLSESEQGFDAIVNDTFDAGTPPAHLTTRFFVNLVHEKLNPGGAYLTNIVSALEGPASAFLDEQRALLESVFESVDVIACASEELSEEDNVIVVARKKKV